MDHLERLNNEALADLERNRVIPRSNENAALAAALNGEINPNLQAVVFEPPPSLAHLEPIIRYYPANIEIPQGPGSVCLLGGPLAIRNRYENPHSEEANDQRLVTEITNIDAEQRCGCANCLAVELEIIDVDLVTEARHWVKSVMPKCTIDANIALDAERGRREYTFDCPVAKAEEAAIEKYNLPNKIRFKKRTASPIDSEEEEIEIDMPGVNNETPRVHELNNNRNHEIL